MADFGVEGFEIRALKAPGCSRRLLFSQKCTARHAECDEQAEIRIACYSVFLFLLNSKLVFNSRIKPIVLNEHRVVNPSWTLPGPRSNQRDPSLRSCWVRWCGARRGGVSMGAHGKHGHPWNLECMGTLGINGHQWNPRVPMCTTVWCLNGWGGVGCELLDL